MQPLSSSRRPPDSGSRFGRFGRLLPTVALLALAIPVLSIAQTPEESPEEPAAETPAAPPPAPELALFLEADAAVVTGLAPGGEALLFTIAREPLGYLSRVSRRDEVVTADETGTAVFVPTTAEGEPVPVETKSVWVAVDLETGTIATAVAAGFEAPRRGLPAGALRRGPSQRIDRLVDRMETAQVAVVRPGTPEARGIWGLTLMDGSLYDEDGADDGGLEMAFDRLIPLAGSAAPPPEEAMTGDVLVVVDTDSLAFFATRLDL